MCLCLCGAGALTAALRRAKDSDEDDDSDEQDEGHMPVRLPLPGPHSTRSMGAQRGAPKQDSDEEGGPEDDVDREMREMRARVASSLTGGWARLGVGAMRSRNTGSR